MAVRFMFSIRPTDHLSVAQPVRSGACASHVSAPARIPVELTESALATRLVARACLVAKASRQLRGGTVLASLKLRGARRESKYARSYGAVGGALSTEEASKPACLRVAVTRRRRSESSAEAPTWLGLRLGLGLGLRLGLGAGLGLGLGLRLGLGLGVGGWGWGWVWGWG